MDAIDVDKGPRADHATRRRVFVVAAAALLAVAGVVVALAAYARPQASCSPATSPCP